MRLSSDGGSAPGFSSDGGQVFFVQGRRAWLVSLVALDPIRASVPRLFSDVAIGASTPIGGLDAARDGRLLVIKLSASSQPARGIDHLRLVLEPQRR